MYDTLSPIQKEKFLAISGEVYEDHRRDEIILRHLKIGKFLTKHAYNDKDWKYSPWRFTFVLEKETGHFVCELSHRMTNNRIYGWDQEGNELSTEVLHKFFKPELVFKS